MSKRFVVEHAERRCALLFKRLPAESLPGTGQTRARHSGRALEGYRSILIWSAATSEA